MKNEPLLEIWTALDNISKTLQTTYELHVKMVEVLMKLDKDNT